MLLVTYDIPNDTRRTRLAKRLEQLGQRVQYSVFILRNRDLQEVCSVIEFLIDPEEDNVRIHPIDQDAERRAILLELAAKNIRARGPLHANPMEPALHETGPGAFAL